MAADSAYPRKNRQRIVVSVVVVAAVLLVAGWYWSTTRELHKVSVAWSASPQCSGTTVQDRHYGGRAVAAVVVRPAMSCTLDVQVMNRSLLTVTLHKLVMPYLGSETGMVVKAASVNGMKPRTDPDHSIDAEHLIGRSLAPGRTHTLTVTFVYHDAGCMAAAVSGVGEWPWLVVSALGRTVVVKGSETFAVSSPQQVGGGCSD